MSRCTTTSGRRALAAAGLVAVLSLTIALGSLPLPSARGATCTINWTGASTNNWNDAKSWDLNREPTTADFACIPASYAQEVVVGIGTTAATGGLQADNPDGVHVMGFLQIASTASTITRLVLEGDLQVDSFNSVTTLTLTGSSAWSAGTISAAFPDVASPPTSEIVVAPGASLAVTGPDPQRLPRQVGLTVIVNHGTLDWNSGDWCLTGGGVRNDGTFNIRSEGRIFECFVETSTPAQVVNEAAGSIVRTGSTGTSSIALPLGVTNRGTVDLTSGILDFTGPFSSSGTSVFQPHIAGAAAGTGFGQMVVAGALTLDGAVNPITASGFVPASLQAFPVIICRSCGSQHFASSSGPYEVLYNTGEVTLVYSPSVAALDPPSLDFGSVVVGSSRGPRVVKLVNNGSTALHLTGVQLVGSDRGDFRVTSNDCGAATLSPGGSCSVSLSFFPSGIGARSAALSFTDDAPGSPQSSSLTGTGIPVAVPAGVLPSPTPGPSPTRRAPASPKAVTPTPTIAVTPTPTPSESPSPEPVVTTPPPADGFVPAFQAVSVLGLKFGPPGVGLNASVHQYPPECKEVFFSFDETRIGSAPVGPDGHALASRISVPGDAKPGTHTVSSTCHLEGRAVELSVPFKVTPGLHRSALVTSLQQPREVTFTVASVRASALITLAVLVLLGFPAQVFNATLQENYEEVRRWFDFKRPLSEVVERVDQRILFPIFLLVGGALYALLTPDFAFNRSTLALTIGLGIALAITTLGFALPSFAYFRARFRDRGKVLVLPGTVLVAAAFVGISRLLHFQPGYLYGALAIFVFHHDPDKKTAGRLAGTSAAIVLALAIVAWVARVPVTDAAMERTGFWWLVLEAALAGTFLIGLESVLVGLLPMRFLDGSKIRSWSKVAWAALFGLGVFTLVEVLLMPGSGYVGQTTKAGRYAVLSMYIAFALFSFGFWAYFRFRKAPPGRELEAEGDYGVR